jgi:hypothetical protein
MNDGIKNLVGAAQDYERLKKETKGAQSHSKGKKKLGNIFRWLDDGFLILMSEQMRIPVEELKKYDKGNWQTGVGDEEFIIDRQESALRHIQQEMIDPGSVDHETGQPHTVCAAVNCMMVNFCQRGVK